MDSLKNPRVKRCKLSVLKQILILHCLVLSNIFKFINETPQKAVIMTLTSKKDWELIQYQATAANRPFSTFIE